MNRSILEENDLNGDSFLLRSLLIRMHFDEDRTTRDFFFLETQYLHRRVNHFSQWIEGIYL